MAIERNPLILQRPAGKRQQNRDMEHVHVCVLGPDQKIHIQHFLQTKIMKPPEHDLKIFYFF